ncbi:MAG: hypothetical protein KDA47_07000 [Planctomycetales bacterium]|nr:hypothetical protein [Planctomycetales bacterium]
MFKPETRSLARRRLSLAIVALLVIGVGLAWRFQLLRGAPTRPARNSIMVIAPYDYNGAWVFDDPRVGLVREPFVAGVPEMIDLLVADVPNAKQGFRLLFSAQPFPGYQKMLTWQRGDRQGNYYKLNDPPMEGWICPALFKYYESPPQNLYVRAEPKSRMAPIRLK